eukprot:5927413-Ditylum_brightwellii.AAC.1
MPITPSIIRHVNKLAELDHMPKDLKITNKRNEVLFDFAAIAGVDYDVKAFDNDNYSKDKDNDDSDSESEGNSENEYDEVDENELAEILNGPVLSKDYNNSYGQSDNEEEIENQEDIKNEEELRPSALDGTQEIIFEDASDGEDGED